MAESTVLAEGGVAPLVEHLSRPHLESREQAAAALHRLSVGSPDAQAAIAAADGISPLVALLDPLASETEGTREAAAASLSHLALLADNADAIVAADGIAPLVGLLTCGSDDGRRCSLPTLRLLLHPLHAGPPASGPLCTSLDDTPSLHLPAC